MKVEEGMLVSSEVVGDSYSGVLPDCDQAHGSGERGFPSPQLMVIWVRRHSSSASRKGSGCKGGPKPLSKGSMACGTRRVVGSCSLAVVCQQCVFDISFEFFTHRTSQSTHLRGQYEGEGKSSMGRTVFACL